MTPHIPENVSTWLVNIQVELSASVKTKAPVTEVLPG
jgi:hypothetical protein